MQQNPRYVLLTLLHTNDLHGCIHLPGQAQGLARIATLVRRIRRERGHVLLLEAGDMIHGTAMEKTFGPLPVVSAMNALRYDAATAGNHEFDFGQDVARDFLRRASFPTLSANVVDATTGKPWDRLIPFIVREMDGVRVAIFGMTTPTTVSIEWPRTLAGIHFQDPIAAGKTLVPHLRTVERADVVVFLSHLGYQPDRQFAAAVPGVDVILGGHSHTTLNEPVWVNETLIVQTGCFGRALGRVDLIVRKVSNEPGRVALVNGRSGRWWGHDGVPAPRRAAFPDSPLIPVTDDLPEDPAVLAAYRPFAERLRPVLDETLTHLDAALASENITEREMPLGNLLADAVRAQTGAEIALIAGSQVGPSGLAAGPISVRDLYVLLPAFTRQHLVIVRAPGTRIGETLDAAMGSGHVPYHVSGLDDRNAPITIGGAPLGPDRTYTVAAPAHVVQDTLLGKAGVEIVQDDPHDPTLRDAAIAFLRYHAAGRVSLDPIHEARLSASS